MVEVHKQVAEQQAAPRQAQSHTPAAESESNDRVLAFVQAMGGFDTIGQILGRYVSSNPGDPRGYRLLIDSARHYLSTSTIKRAVDSLAQNHLNVLHWHAVDAESFVV